MVAGFARVRLVASFYCLDCFDLFVRALNAMETIVAWGNSDRYVGERISACVLRDKPNPSSLTCFDFLVCWYEVRNSICVNLAVWTCFFWNEVQYVLRRC